MYASKGNKYLDKAYQTEKKMCYIRTPPEIWEQLNQEFHFTLDTCASDKNHLCDHYFTKETDGLNQDWEDHIAYVHPMYDKDLPKWVKKCSERKGISVMLLPASTHTAYFHKYIYKNPQCEIRFLPNPHKNGKAGWFMATDDGEYQTTKVGYIRPLMILVFNNK